VTSITGKIINRQAGFTYIMALLAVALVTIASSVAYTSSRHVVLKAKEQELWFRGVAYYRAIESYYLARSPHQYPTNLQDLLKDPRFLHKRHLRKLYLQTDGAPWQLLKDKSGAIIGVYFDSPQRPINQASFTKPFEHFSRAQTYADWRFVYLPFGQ